MGGQSKRSQKPWTWDKHFEDAFWIVAQQVISSAREHFDASRNDAAGSLVLLIDRLKDQDTRARIPYEVRRQLAHDVVNELEELAERAHRYAEQLLASVPAELKLVTSNQDSKRRG